MSLIKQLWLAIILLITLATGGSFILSTLTSKHSIEQQLQLKNDDNATTLALLMTQLPKDPVTLDLLLSAQFDTGHYRYIGLVSPDRKVISERINTKSATKAPAWFTQLVSIELNPGRAEIQDGWSQFGTIQLESDENFAYDKLWDSTIAIALWALLIGLISCYLGEKILKKILSPLDHVVNQAQAIGNNRFVMIDVPKTKEFKAVVHAMNTLSGQVKKTLSEESERLNQLSLDSNFDHITGLMNYEHFINKADATISHEEYFHEGNLIIARLQNIAEIDQKLGYQATNSLLKNVGDALLNECAHHPELFAGRLSGADFAVFSSSPADSYTLGSKIKHILNIASNIDHANLAAHYLVIAARIHKSDNAKTIIQSADHVLDNLKTGDGDQVHVIHTTEMNQQQNNDLKQWETLLTSAFDSRSIKLESYPVINQLGKLIHFESPVRLQFSPGGKWFCAGEFITWAIQLNLMQRLDSLVLETAIDSLTKGAKPIGINLSASSVCDLTFVDHAISLIKNSPQIAAKLYFEIPEQSAFDHLSEFKKFCIQVKTLGCKVGIEHVGSRISRLGELHDVGLDYIKIDASVIREINTNEANKTLLRGICMIAHSIGLIAIAEGVQNAHEMNALRLLGVDGMTGPAIKLS
ncbi:MAG: GGDEF domain-containing protein [Betaproteobacteria bacterium HGW-Betaproteobacteria-22]|nr:MAG: GGDEF domain-containing protein [Betaproteobacteria bacterium HGW-Betaproteobacteria-22]